MSTQAVWFNGHLVDPESPLLNADDHGLVVGDGVFETLLPVPDFKTVPDAAAEQQSAGAAEGAAGFRHAQASGAYAPLRRSPRD